MQSISMLYTVLLAFTAVFYSYLFAVPFHPFHDKDLFKAWKLCLIHLFISTVQHSVLSLENKWIILVLSY